ncbi:hypothetical protein BGX29_010427 [Mortierella sp. GBA35]|nr:hypothetical protein BGX29_010427 [Mortierella sp. GBA35]
MSDRSWSPPLEIDTKTTTTVSVVRARPEHLSAIHKIQVLAYPGRTDFHESEDVFRSKLEAYPAGNFIALATYSVVTHDDTSTWQSDNNNNNNVAAEKVGVGEVEIEDGEGDEEDEGGVVHGISVVEITETGPDGSSTTTTTTTTLGDDGSETTSHVDIVRARTPDISEGTDEEDGNEAHDSSHQQSSGLEVPHSRTGRTSTRGLHSKTGDDTGSNNNSDPALTKAPAAAAGGENGDEGDTTVLFQWEEPVGYLFSHPYSRESVTLHRLGAGTRHSVAHQSTTGAAGSEASSKPKRIRLDGGGGGNTEATGVGKAGENDGENDGDNDEDEGEDTMFDHDQWMEKYYVHDCAIHPGWRGQGLASKLWKALEESLIPIRDADNQDEGASGTGAGQEAGSGTSGDLVDTEEEEEDDGDEMTRRRGRRGSKKSHGHGHGHGHAAGGHSRRRRRGAPNLKEIVLVSVQGTKPFWERAGGFQAVTDHDIDLSVYGDEAFLMHKAFVF